MTETDQSERWKNAREIMAREGVPDHVIDHVLAQQPSVWIYQLATWSFVAVMIAGFGVGAIFWILCEQQIENQARAFSTSIGGVLFDYSFGIGFLILLFAWILISGVVVSQLYMRWPRARASLFVFTLLDAKNRYAFTFGSRLRSLSVIDDPDEYVLAASSTMNKTFGSIGAALAAAGLTFLIWELDTYTVYSPQGFVAKPLLPWEDVKRGDWRDAEFVEVGCNHVVGKNASDDIIYDVNFTDGSSRRLSSATASNGDLVGALDTIDKALRAAGVRFERWKWMERDPLHPACLAAQKKRYSAEEFARLQRILRVGEFIGDR